MREDKFLAVDSEYRVFNHLLYIPFSLFTFCMYIVFTNLHITQHPYWCATFFVNVLWILINK